MEKNQKLNLQDIIDLVALKQNIAKDEAETFVKEFFSLIQESLSEDNPIKIKDFGTFKLTLIQARESVNVNTGEKIEIPAHYRFSFSPATALKELVNKPFSAFESTLLYDELHNEDESEENEEVDIEEEEEIEEDDIVFVVEPRRGEPTCSPLSTLSTCSPSTTDNETIIEEEIVIEQNETSETSTERKLPKNAFAIVFGIIAASVAMIAVELFRKNKTTT